MHVKAQGEVRLLELRKPWPLDGHLALELDGQGADSPLCVRRYVPSLSGADDCSVRLDMTAKGNIDRLDVALSGRGQSLVLQAQVGLAPSAAFPLRNATVGLELADGSFLHGKFDWVATLPTCLPHDRVPGSMDIHKLNVGVLSRQEIR